MKIAFCGLMRSGKDTSAEYFVKKYGGRILKFADPLYEMQNAIYRIAQLPEKKDRCLLQLIGTEWGRHTIDPNIWVNITVERIRELGPGCSVYVTDMRFPNEEEALRKEGFTIVKIVAPPQDLLDRGASRTTHESEQFMQTYEGADITIYNYGTLEDLYAKLDDLYANLLASGVS